MLIDMDDVWFGGLCGCHCENTWHPRYDGSVWSVLGTVFTTRIPTMKISTMIVGKKSGEEGACRSLSPWGMRRSLFYISGGRAYVWTLRRVK